VFTAQRLSVLDRLLTRDNSFFGFLRPSIAGRSRLLQVIVLSLLPTDSTLFTHSTVRSHYPVQDVSIPSSTKATQSNHAPHLVIMLNSISRI